MNEEELPERNEKVEKKNSKTNGAGRERERDIKKWRVIRGKCVWGGMKDGKKRKRNGGLQEKVIEETE